MNSEQKKIVILNFATGQTLVRTVHENMLESDASDICHYFADKENFKDFDCQYMVVNDSDFIIDTDFLVDCFPMVTADRTISNHIKLRN